MARTKKIKKQKGGGDQEIENNNNNDNIGFSKEIKDKYIKELIKNKTCYCFLSEKNIPKHERDQLLKGFTSKQVNTLSWLCNQCFYHSGIKLPEKEKRKLKRHSKFLDQFTNNKNNIDKKRKLLRQKGGFLPLLLPFLIKPLLKAVAPLAISAIAGKIIK